VLEHGFGAVKEKQRARIPFARVAELTQRRTMLLSSTESHARRSAALRSALGPLMEFLVDDRVVELMLNPDGTVWVEAVGTPMRPATRMAPIDAERMLRLIASELSVELTADTPSLSGKLPAPWGARVQAAIPPIVDAPTFALRKPARVVFSLED